MDGPFVAGRAGKPGDPGKDHGLIVLALNSHRKRRQLTLRHVISPAFDDCQRAILLEHGGCGFRMAQRSRDWPSGRQPRIHPHSSCEVCLKKSGNQCGFQKLQRTTSSGLDIRV
jgi:hypothetical protein